MSVLRRLLRSASVHSLLSSSILSSTLCIGAADLSRFDSGLSDPLGLPRAAAILAVSQRPLSTDPTGVEEAASGLSAPAEDSAGSPATASSEEREKRIELVAAFTCNKCGTRTARAFSRVAYERGVVIARCGGCEGQHLLSDRLGWFGEAGSAEDFLRERGASVRKQTDGTVEISEEDLVGWTKSTA